MSEKPGQGPDCLEALRTLHLSDEDINKIYAGFLEFDISGDGTVDLVEFLTILNIEETPITREIFDELDNSGDHSMTFKEFALNIWHYCVKDKKAIAQMAFDIFDINDNGTLSDQELRQMVSEIYGKKGMSHDLKTIMKKLDKNKDNQISRSEFVNAAHQFPALLFPAFHMQTTFQQRIGGEAFWKDKCLQASTFIDSPEVQALFASKKTVQKRTELRRKKAAAIEKSDRSSNRSSNKEPSSREEERSSKRQSKSRKQSKK